MTNDTTYREKGRAVILAALMVLSVVAMSAAFAGSAAANIDDYTEGEDVDRTFDENSNLEESLLWQGQEVAVGGFTSDSVTLYEYDAGDERSSTIEELNVDENVVEFDTDDLDGDYYLATTKASDTPTTFEVTTQNLNVAFDEDEVDDDETVDIEFDSNRGSYDLNVSADGLDDDDLEDIFYSDSDGGLENDFDSFDKDDDDEEVLTINGISDGDFAANFTDIDTGEYEFDFESTDTSAADNASISVTEGEDGSLSFADETIETRTNTAVIPVEMDDTDEGYLRVGTMDDAGYEAFLHVEDDDDNEDSTGVVYVEMNTVGAAADLTSEDGLESIKDSFTTADDDDSVTLEAIDEESVDDALGAGDYPLSLSTDIDDALENADDMNIEEGDVEAFEDAEEDTSYLTLEERQPLDDDAVTVHTAPQDELSDVNDSFDDDETVNSVLSDENVSGVDTIAEGDGMLATIESDSLYAYFAGHEDVSYETAVAGDHFEQDDGFALNITGEESGPNADPPVWTTNENEADDEANDDVYYIGDHVDIVGSNQTEGVTLLNIDYEAINEDGDIDDKLETDETYDVDLTVEYDWEYASEQADEDEENEVASDSFDFEEPEFELDDSNEELPASAAATVTGDTNLAPHTEVGDRLRSPGNFTQSESDYVAEDGTFSIAHDLSEYSEGINYDLEADASGYTDVSDSLEGTTIAGDALQSFDYDPTFDPAEPAAGDNVSVTIEVENPNDAATSENVHFDFDGETVIDEEVELEAGNTTTLEATLLEDAEEDDYEWELITDDESTDSGTLSVGDTDDSGNESGESGNESGESGNESGESGNESGDSDSSDDGDDGTPGFGVGVALVALLGAAMLALRRQN